VLGWSRWAPPRPSPRRRGHRSGRATAGGGVEVLALVAWARSPAYGSASRNGSPPTILGVVVYAVLDRGCRSRSWRRRWHGRGRPAAAAAAASRAGERGHVTAGSAQRAVVPATGWRDGRCRLARQSRALVPSHGLPLIVNGTFYLELACTAPSRGGAAPDGAVGSDVYAGSAVLAIETLRWFMRTSSEAAAGAGALLASHRAPCTHAPRGAGRRAAADPAPLTNLGGRSTCLRASRASRSSPAARPFEQMGSRATTRVPTRWSSWRYGGAPGRRRFGSTPTRG